MMEWQLWQLQLHQKRRTRLKEEQLLPTPNKNEILEGTKWQVELPTKREAPLQLGLR
jgi:hypothetical protein